MKKLFTLLYAYFLINSGLAQAPYFGWGSASTTATTQSNLFTGQSVAIDGEGNVYTTGYFTGTVDFDPGTGTANLTATSYYDIFIQKLDAQGNYVWAHRMGNANPSNAHYATAISVDASGSVYVAGRFSNTVDFDPGSNTADLTSAGSSDIFILKLSATGNYLSALQIGGTSQENCTGLAIDAGGNICLTGTFSSTVDFDPGANTVNLTSAGNTDNFVLKLSGAGDYLWAKRFGYTSADNVTCMAVDGTGNIYTAGYFSGTVDFDPGASTTSLTSAGFFDYFIQKLDANGNFVWAKRFGSADGDYCNAIAVDINGKVFATGYFKGTVDFDPSTTGITNLTAVGLGDIFVQKLDADGGLIWAKRIGGVGEDDGRAITIDALGNVYTSGYFTANADFDPGSGTSTLTSAGDKDIFIQKLDAAGNYVWAKRIGSTTSDYGYGVAADGGGNVYATGYVSSTVDIDPTGGTLNVTGNNYAICTIKLSDCNTNILANSLDNSILNTLGNTQPVLFTKSCRQIAKLIPNGTSPVFGSTTAKVWIEGTQPTQFVKRHYEITPALNATTATGRVTLYFTQAEFDDFNAINTIDLPTGTADAVGKANLLIEKRSGVSGDGTGIPGTYTGTIETIDPVDADIVWNSTLNRWEVTFDVTGFSGFFVKTVNGFLPLHLTSFSGNRSNDVNNLHWQTQNEINTKHFIVERSSDANSFPAIATIAAKGSGANTYSYNDAVKQNGKLFYRLKMVDNDGRFTYSGIVALTAYNSGTVTVSPNPVTNFTTITVSNNLVNTKAILTDAAGKSLQQIMLAHTATSINLSAYPDGMYLLKLQNGQVIKLIKE